MLNPGLFRFPRSVQVVRLVAAGLLVALGSVALADDRGKSRLWNDSAGKYQVQARLVKVQDQTAHLEREDGRVVQVPIERLSAADRAYLDAKATASTPPDAELSDTTAPSAKPAPSEVPESEPGDEDKPSPFDLQRLLADVNAYYAKRRENMDAVTATDFEKMEEWLAKLRSERGVLSSGEVGLDLVYELLATPDQATEGGWHNHFSLLERWRLAFPKSVSPLVIQARSYIRWGWQARGGGFANTVTPDGWRLFGERLAKARTLLEAAHQLKHNDPDVYVQLINVCKADGATRDEVDRWLSQAQKIDDRYYVLYEVMAEYLLPRWHGERGEVERFASEMAKKVGGKHGLDVYARIICRVNLYEHDVVRRPTISLELLDEAVQEHRVRYPHSKRFLNFAALAAMFSNNRPLARDLKTEIADDPDLSVWGGGEPYEAFRRWCDSVKGPGEQSLSDEHSIANLTYSPDGKWMATTGADLALPVKLWDAKTHKLVREFRGCKSYMRHLAYDPQGERLAAVTAEAVVVVWNIDQPNDPRLMTGHTEHVYKLDWSADGRTIATASMDHTVRIWDPTTGEEKLRIDLPVRGENVRLSPDGKLLAVVGGGRFFIYDAAGQMIHEAVPGAARTLAGLRLREPLRFLEDGSLIVAGRSTGPGADRLLILNPTTGERKAVRDEEIGSFPTLSADGRLLATGKVQVGDPESNESKILRIRVMDLQDGGQIREVKAPAIILSGLAFSPDGATLAVSDHKSAQFWDVASLPKVSPTAKQAVEATTAVSPPVAAKRPSAPPTSAARAAAPATAAPADIAMARSAPVRPPATAGPTALDAEKHILGIFFSVDGKWLATSPAPTNNRWPIRLWNGATRKFVRELSGPDAFITCAAFDRQSKRLFAATVDSPAKPGKAFLWTLDEPTPPLELADHGGVRMIAWAPDGSQLFTAGADNMVRVWDAATGQEVRRMETRHRVLNLCTSPDGKLLAISESNGTVRVLEAATGKVLYEPPPPTGLSEHLRLVQIVALTEDGKALALARNLRASEPNPWLITWDLASGERQTLLENFAGRYPTFSDDLRFAATMDPKASTHSPGVIIWDLIAQRRATFAPDELGLAGWGLSPDGATLVVCTRKNNVHILDVPALIQGESP